jgi:hypothetical protein
MKKIEIRQYQVYRLARRRERGSKLGKLLRRLLHKRH